MLSTLNLRIREYLASYIAGRISFREFQNWFIPAVWNIDQKRDPEAEVLAYGIMLRLAEYLNGDWTEDELKFKLNTLIEFHREVSTSSSSEIKEFSVPRQGLPFDRLISVGYV